MRADLLQVVSVAAYGNAFLLGRDPVPELLTTHSTFQTVNALEFRRVGSLHGGLLAESVNPWLRRLESEGAIAIRPLISACLKDGNESEDVVWGILTDGDRGMEVWRPTWKGRFGVRDDKKPHRVVYNGTRLSRFHLPVQPPIENIATDLGQALKISVDRLREAGQTQQSVGIMQCLAQHREGSVFFGEAADLWPKPSETVERRVAASALRTLATITGPRGVKPTPLEEEVISELWQIGLRALEASLARAPIAKVA